MSQLTEWTLGLTRMERRRLRRLARIMAALAVIGSMIAMIAVTTTAPQQAAADNNGGSHFDLEFLDVDYEYDQQGNPISTWRYRLHWDGQNPELSHLTIGVCANLDEDDLVDSDPDGATLGKDGRRGIWGVKWDWNLFEGDDHNGFGLTAIPDSVNGDVYGTEPNSESVQDDVYQPQGLVLQTFHEQTVEVSFTVRGHWQPVQQDYIAKAGPNTNPTGKVEAPGCDPVEPEPETGKLIIKKYKDWDGDGERDHNDHLLGGATFRVTGPEDYDVTVEDNQDPDQDDRDGIIELRDLVPGQYTVEEIEAPEGWLIDSQSPRQVEVSASSGFSLMHTGGGDGHHDDAAIVTFHDPRAPEPGKLIIKKYKDDDGDGDEDGKLGGATFRVKGPDKYDVTVQDNQPPDADDEDGVIELRGLMPGEYTIVETAAPAGYVAVDDQKTVEIESNESKIVGFLNERESTPATLIIRKYGDENLDGPDFPLGGATFEVCRKISGPDDCFTITDNATGGEHPDEDPADGVIKLTGLRPGEYQVKETGAPEGYRPDTDEQDIELEPGETEEVAFHNERDIDKPAILIFKYGDDGDGELDDDDDPLGGATFRFEWKECRWGDCQTEHFDVTDNDNRDLDKRPGIILVDGLDDDEEYKVYEVDAPEGWNADDKVYDDIDLGRREIRELKFLNERKPGALIIKKDRDDDGDGQSDGFLAGATFLITGPSYPQGLSVKDNDGIHDEDNTAGVIRITGLEWGEYTVEETAAPDGYLKETDVEHVTIDAGSLDVSVAFLNERWEPGDVGIVKVDQNQDPVAGAQFELRDDEGNVVAFGSTGADGRLVFADIDPGTYTLVETAAPPGYEKADPDSVTVTVNRDGTVNPDPVSMVNAKRLGSLRILKHDAEGKSLGGATFQVTGPGGYNQTFTDSDGDGEIEVTGLEWGQYQVTETGAPEGYDADPTPKNVTIGATQLTVQVTFVNTPKDGSLRIIKHDNAGKPLGGATFQVTGPGGYDETFTDDDGDGVILVSGLEWGDYQVTEIQAPQGYNPDPKPQDVTIGATQLTVEVTFVNTPKDGSLRIIKHDNAGKPLGGATFQVTGPDGYDETFTDDDGDGVIEVTGLEWGDYQVTEIQAPQGYNPDPKPQDVTIGATQLELTVTFVNTPKDGSLRIIKHDNAGKPLGGATFQVTGPDGYDETFTDDDGDGVILVTGLEWGDYQVTEIQAPQGYNPDPKPQDVTIGATQLELTVTFVNTPKDGSLRIEKYRDDDGDGQSDGPLAGATFLITGPSYPQGLSVKDNDSVRDEDNTPGVIKLSGLAWGHYTIVETAAPDGYLKDTTQYGRQIGASSLDVTVSFLNERWEPGDVEIVKVDQNEDPVAGALFELRDDQGDVVASGSTGADGRLVFEDIDPGTYTLVETAAPAGYEKADPASVIVTVARDGTVNPDPVSMVNAKRLGSLRILKHDAEGQPLGGATFRVTGPDGYDQTFTDSDGDGVIEVTGLKWGQYQITETQAPEGYDADSTPKDVTIGATQLTVQVTFVNQPKAGSLRILKHDAEGQPLGGATFRVTGPDGYDQTFTDSDGDGEIEVTGLKWGQYQITETQAPEGYDADSTPKNVTIGATQLELTVTFVNTPKDGSLRILKHDAEGQPLGGATFRVTGPDGYDQTFTDSDGDGEIEVTGLKWGQYQITETQAPEGYDADSTPKDVTIGATQLTVQVTFVNQPKAGSLRILKHDAEGQPLGGATFRVTGPDGYDQTFTDSDGDGEIEVTGLKWGQYQITETQAPEGYDADSTPKDVTIGASQLTVEVTFVNTPKAGSLRIVKHDAEGQSLGGATFRVTGPGGYDQTFTDSNGDGVIEVSGLEWGDYEITETQAPEGYDLDSTPKDVTIGATQLTVEVTFVNTPKDGSLRILKHDAEGQSLGGATFRVTGPGGYDETFTDNNGDGVIEVSGLEWGDYEITETQAPEGYELDSTPKDVTIGATQLTVEVTFVNTPKAGSLRIIKEDNQGNRLGGAEFEVTGPSYPQGITVADGGANDSDGAANGEILLTGLVWGQYEVTETQAPQGYDADPAPKQGTIGATQLEISFTFVNEPKDGSLRILKEDAEGQPLGGAEFKVTGPSYPQGTTVVDGGANDSDGAANGEIVLTGLHWGDYEVKETGAPEGYDADSTPKNVTIGATQLTVEVTFVNTPKDGSLRIEKYRDDDGDGQSDGSLAGATFLITGPSYPQGLSVKDNDGVHDEDNTPGVIRITGLKWGEYTVEETAAPDGYLRDTHFENVTIGAEELTVTVRFLNERWQPGDIEIVKVDQNQDPVAGAQFELRDDAGDVVASGSTGTDGRLVFEDIAPGTYTLVETAAPAGYEKADPDSVTVTVNRDGTVNPDPVRMVNAKRSGSLRIIKHDHEGQPLGGATFQVAGPDGYDETFTDDDGDGVIEVSGLAWGDYQVTETQAPDGYRLDPTQREVTVNASNLTLTVEFVNVPEVPGTVVIRKVDQHDNPVEGARFELRDAQGNLVAEGVTDEKGILEFEEVEPGTYTVVEVEAPFGYVIDEDNTRTVVIALDGTVDPDTLVFRNDKLQGSVTVLKLDADTEERLAGATFVLRDENGAELDRRTTDGTGEIAFSDLDPGTYTIEEITPPPGYRVAEPDSVEVTVTIVETPDGLTVEVTPPVVVFENEEDDTPPPPPSRRPRVDLAVTKVVDDPTPEEGQLVTFTITVTNLGPDDAEDVVYADLVPAGLTYIAHVASQGVYDPAAGEWEVGDLDDDAQATLVVTAQVDTGTAGRTIVNTVTLASSTPEDSDPSNNSDSAQVAPPQLVIIEEEPPAAEPPLFPPLPITGGNSLWLLVAGVMALGAGLYLRRRRA